MRHKILVVDDQKNITNQTAEILSPLYDVFTTNDGETAMQLIEEKKPELILLDWLLQGTIQGEDVLKFSKNKFPDILVYVISASFDRRAKAMQLGADQFLEKPCFDLPEHVRRAFSVK